MRPIALILFCLCIFCSCNSYFCIEKRKYRGGYHVEWYSNKSALSNPLDTKINDVADQKSVNLLSEDLVLACASKDSIQCFVPLESKGHLIPEQTILDDTLRKKRWHRRNELGKFDERKDATNLDNRKLSPLAVTGAILGTVSAAFFFGNGIFFELAFLIGLVGLIITILAWHQLKNHNDKYYGKTIANIAFVLNGLIIFYLAMLLGLFALLGFN